MNLFPANKNRFIIDLFLAAGIIFLALLGYVTGKASDIAENLSSKNIAAMNEIEKTKEKMSAIIKTNFGDIEVEFFEDKAPVTVANFLKLSNENFYDGIKFHRVIKDFMIQAGDPLSKDDSQKNKWGTGGPGYKFEDEIKKDDEIYKTGYKRGILAMANAGPNTNGSQFFIMHKDVNLPPNYTIFGQVIKGMDVVDKIAEMETYMPGQIDRPVNDITIEAISVR